MRRHERVGAEARRLLGGDERLHVYPTAAEAAAYLARMPGARVWAPRFTGWKQLLEVARAREIPWVKDGHIDVRWDQKRYAKYGSTAIEVALAIRRAGAASVTINGRAVPESV